jgi:hypothetical protein
MAKIMKACPQYSDGIWALSVASPAYPDRFKCVHKDFRTKDEAKDYARLIAKDRNWEIDFVTSCVAD